MRNPFPLREQLPRDDGGISYSSVIPVARPGASPRSKTIYPMASWECNFGDGRSPCGAWASASIRSPPLDGSSIRAQNHLVACINRKVIQELRALESGGAPGFVSELIDLFLKEADRHLATLKTGLAGRDAPLFARAAHTLKGSSGNLGALEMSRICEELQSVERTKDWSRAAELLPRLEAEFQAAKSELEAEKAGS